MKKVLLVASILLPLAASIASAEVSLTEKQRLRDAIGAPASLSMEHVLRQIGAKDTGSISNLVDSSGLKYFINTDIDFLTTSSGEGAMSEASYTHAVAASTLNGGTTSSTLNDMFDGYNELYVNGISYGAEIVGGVTNTRGLAVVESNQRQVVTGPQSIAGLTVWRKIFVPANDTFARWLNYVQNTSGAPILVSVSNGCNLGSDNNTRLDTSSLGVIDASSNVDVSTTWQTTFQDFTGTNVTTSDPRIGHVLQGVSRRVGLSSISFAVSNDNPSWSHTFTVAPGETAIIAWFVTGQPNKSAARAKAAELAAQSNTHMWDFMTASDKAHVLNFSAAIGVVDDFDGDGASDLGVYSRSTWYLFQSTAGFETASIRGTPVYGDFDGDGESDIATFSTISGNWVIRGSAGTTWTQQFGTASTTPAAGDFDGDGKADIAVFDPSTGTWFILGSTSGFVQFTQGAIGGVPVVGDYDGDGKADLATYSKSSATWIIRSSLTSIDSTTQFGFGGVTPVPGDYDGDGKTDLAVYDPKAGNWYLMQSTAGFAITQFGSHGMQPVVGDYDGDGKTDLVVYKRFSGTWFMMDSTAGFKTIQFGYAPTAPLGGK